MTISSVQPSCSITSSDTITIDLSNITAAGSSYTTSNPVTITGGGYSLNTNVTTGTSGSTLSYSNGTTGWTQPNTNFNDGSTPVMKIPYGTKTVEIDEKATLDVKGNVKINGIDLEERLKTIEKVLMIPERDAIMEAKYPSLKKKYDEYINALEKYRTFERIKGTDNDQ